MTPAPARSEAIPTLLRLPGADGITLVADGWGNEAMPLVLLLHGGGQTRGAWAGAGPKIAARGFYVVAPDLRGHGESDWSTDRAYSFDVYASDVRAVARWLERPVLLVGASLGGICSLLAAGEAPRVDARALVLVDVAHQGAPLGLSRILAFMGDRPDGFATLDEAAAAVAAYLPHRTSPEKAEGLKRNLRLRDGRWVWHWDPHLLDGFTGVAELPGLADRCLTAARAVGRPILVVRGGSSDVLTPEIAREFCAAVPTAECVDVAGAAHMVAGDRNDRFVLALLPFLDRIRPGA